MSEKKNLGQSPGLWRAIGIGALACCALLMVCLVGAIMHNSNIHTMPNTTMVNHNVPAPAAVPMPVMQQPAIQPIVQQPVIQQPEVVHAVYRPQPEIVYVKQPEPVQRLGEIDTHQLEFAGAFASHCFVVVRPAEFKPMIGIAIAQPYLEARQRITVDRLEREHSLFLPGLFVRAHSQSYLVIPFNFS